MLQIGSAIVSLDIIEKHFCCDLSACRGACCVFGESGAPLEDDEVSVLQDVYPKVKPYMTDAGIEVVEKHGVFNIDLDNEIVTPLVGNSEDCAFAVSENGISSCAIEKAFLNGDISFRKPVSCHLYPVRVTKYEDFEAVNFHNWSICKEALELGKKNDTPLYVFLKEPLVRKFGSQWYEQLLEVIHSFI